MSCWCNFEPSDNLPLLIYFVYSLENALLQSLSRGEVASIGRCQLEHRRVRPGIVGLVIVRVLSLHILEAHSVHQWLLKMTIGLEVTWGIRHLRALGRIIGVLRTTNCHLRMVETCGRMAVVIGRYDIFLTQYLVLICHPWQINCFRMWDTLCYIAHDISDGNWHFEATSSLEFLSWFCSMWWWHLNMLPGQVTS